MFLCISALPAQAFSLAWSAEAFITKKNYHGAGDRNVFLSEDEVLTVNTVVAEFDKSEGPRATLLQ